MFFERDIFISYAFLDNLSVKGGEYGWVEDFHKAMRVRLAHLMKEDPEIFCYTKKGDCDIFIHKIDEKLSKSAILILILSQKYIQSECCIRELKEFIKPAVSGIEKETCDKSRIIKILKTAVPYDAIPPEIKDILGYEFYIIDPSTDRIKELDCRACGQLEQIYWARLDDVAHDICDALERIKQADVTGIPGQEEQLKIYLAETSSDLKAQRDIIKRELIENGHEILPDCQLPLVGPEFEKTVEDFLDQCDLSIHLVGGGYGLIPEGSRTSIVELQNELAVKKSKNRKFQRLIWKPPGNGIEINDERQERFINLIRTDSETQYGADMFETPLIHFKYAIRDKINSIKSAPISIMGKPTVYLAETDYSLQKQRESIKRQLIDQGYKVLPDQPLPLIYPHLVEILDTLLDQCDISIHLMGEAYGIVPSKTEKSIIFIQNEQAAEKSSQGQLLRLVRLSPTIDQEDERQRLFIESLKAEAKKETHPNDDIFETTLEDIEPTIFKKLTVFEEEKRKKIEVEEVSSRTAVEPGKGPPQIYLLCELRDLDNITELEDFFYKSEFDVVLPVFDGEEEDLIRDHRENLKFCDAAVIYHGAGSELWLRAITRDFRKIAGYGRTRPLVGKAIFLAPPVTRAKERFRSHDWHIINGFAGFSPELIEPFIEILKSSIKS